MTDFSPREIVSELDRFIIGQGDAKRAVAIAAGIDIYTNSNLTVEELPCLTTGLNKSVS